MIFAAESNNGLIRHHNEDNFCFTHLPGQPLSMAVVADGVGGHSNGAMASLIVCRDLFRASLNYPPEEPAAAFLDRVIGESNRRIFERNRFEEQLRPMCSTVIAALFSPEQIAIAGAGDSRFYEYAASGVLFQHSCDHTLFSLNEELRSSCRLSAARMREVVVKAVGPRQLMHPELKTIPRHPGSCYLLCSDGVSHMVGDAEIARCLKVARTPRQAVDALLKAALRQGGRDNLTAVVAFEEN